MPDASPTLRAIDWAEAFPFVRIFRAFVMAIWPVRLLLALAAVVACYLVGRLFDGIWLGGSRDGGAVVAVGRDTRTTTELEAFATLSSVEFRDWREATLRGARAYEIDLVRRLAGATSDEDAVARLRADSARRLLQQAREDTPQAIRDLIDARARAGREFIRADDSNPAALSRGQRLEELQRAADCLRFIVGGRDPRSTFTQRECDEALNVLLAADPHLTGAERTEVQNRLARSVTRESALISLSQRAPVGPFISLLRYEARCAAAAVTAVVGLRFGAGGTAFDAQPTLIGSLGSAARGFQWLVVERPLFALLAGGSMIVILSFVCGALARMAAVQAARDEHVSVSSALRFAREKFIYLLLAPGLPLSMLLPGAALLVLGGLVGAIPVVGEALAAAFFVLALVAGTLMALVAVATLLGFNLMWPIIAVEHSDGFDAVSRGFNYVASRCAHLLFYNVVLAAYAAAVMLLVRLVAMVALKFTHVCVGIGMSVFGLASSDRTEGLGPLDAIWRMPAWADLTLLPGAVPFWGRFGQAPLSASETFASWLIMAWVFLHVGLVLAVGLNLWLCGSTQIYLLLRRQVDATDYSEVFVDDDFDLPAPAAPEPPPERTGTPLPVISTPPPEH